MKQLLTILFFFTIASLLSQSEGGFGFRRFADLTALNATSVNNSDKSASRRAYVNSTGLYYVWNGSAWIAEVAIDTFSVSGSTLSLSLLRDGVPAKTVTIDPSVTNEGQLNVSAIAPPNAGVITSNTSGSNTIIIQGGTGITVTPNSGTHTITIEGGAEGLIDTVKNIDSLRTYSGTRPIVFVKDEPQTGFFKRLDTTVVDDGGILIHGVSDWVRIAENLNEVNIKWFGAVGDSSNAEAAKNLAVAYCAANRNTTLYIPGGKYYFTTPIYIYRPQNIGIKGDGPYATYLFFKDCDGISLRTDSVTYQTNAFYGAVDGRDLIIKDLSIYRVGTYTTKKTGILLRGVGFNIKLSDLRVQLYTSILGTIGSVGINLTTASTSFFTDAVQHTVLSNVYVTECDTNVVSYLRNTMEWNNVNIDQANEVGVVLNNSLHWSGGMLQGSNKCGLFLVNKNPYVLYDVRLEKLHIEGAAGQPVYGQIYKPDATDMKNLTIKNSIFSAGGNSMIMNLKRVLYMDITDNSYNAGTTDTIKLTSIYSGRFGNGNFTSAKLVTSDVYIDWWNGSPSSTSTLVGFTIGKSSPGRNFLNVGGDTGIDGELGVGTQVPLSQFHVSTGDLQDTTIIRMQNSTGFTQLFRGTATPEGDVVGNPGDFFYSNISGTGDWFGKLTGTGNTGWVEFYHTGNLPASTNIYNSDGTITDGTRTVTIDTVLNFNAEGVSSAINMNLYDDGSHQIGSENIFSPEYTQIYNFYKQFSIYDINQTLDNAGNTTVFKTIEVSKGGVGEGSDYIQQKIMKDSLGNSDFEQMYIAGIPINNDSAFNQGFEYIGHNIENSFGDMYSSRYAWGVQLKKSGADSTHFNFIDINLDEGIFKNSIEFYDKYKFPNITPSSTVGDSSVIIWVGNGTNTTPVFAPYSGGGSATNIYNSDGTITDNTRTATITESIQWIGTADIRNPYPFQIHVTGNEPPIQLWKGNTDSVWIKQSDVEYHFGSSTHLVIESTDKLTISADSILANTLESQTKLQSIVGITNLGTLKKIAGSSSNQVLKWNTAGYWELGTVSGAVADGDYGDITVSSSGTVWTIDAGVVSNSKLASGTGGIYKGSGTIASGTVSTLTSTSTWRVNYSGGNSALLTDDANNASSLFGQSGTYAVSADNSQSYLSGALSSTFSLGSTGGTTLTASVANTNTVNTRETIITNSSGIAATGLGAATLYQLESSTTNSQDAAEMDVVWSDATHASRTGDFVFKTVASAASLAEAFRIGGTNYQLTATANVSNTNTAADRLVIKTNSSGTAAAGFGGGLLLQLESSTTDNRDAGRMYATWTTATDGSRTSKIQFQTVNNAGALTDHVYISPTGIGVSAAAGGNTCVYGNASITPTTAFSISAGSNAITLQSTSNTATAITIQPTNNTTGGIQIGGVALTSTTLGKKEMLWNSSYTVSSGSGTHTAIAIENTYNLTSTASGLQTSISINPTFTSLTGTYRAIDIAANNSNAKGIYQTGSSTTNNFVGKTTFGATTSPTALVLLAAGTATANTAPLKFTSGTNLSSVEDGAVEYDGSNYFGSVGSTRYTFAKCLNGSATLDFGNTASFTSADLTITVTGASDGDVVSLGVPNGSTSSTSVYTAWVSATNTVTVRFTNISFSSVNPASGTFKVTVIKQ